MRISYALASLLSFTVFNGVGLCQGSPGPHDFALRTDPKLQARLTVWEDDPPLAILVERLRAATGLDLALAPGLAEHDPVLGSVHLKDAHAWMVMGVLAERDLDGGRWVKTDGGYRLEGRSTLPPRPRGLVPWQLAGLFAVGACAAAFGGALAYRVLRRPRPTS